MQPDAVFLSGNRRRDVGPGRWRCGQDADADVTDGFSRTTTAVVCSLAMQDSIGRRTVDEPAGHPGETGLQTAGVLVPENKVGVGADSQ